MTKKVKKDDDGFDTENTQETAAEVEGINIEADFDTTDEFKADPLIPQGTYTANVVKNRFDSEKQAVIFTYCLVDNGGVMSDGETPVDGVTIQSSVWLPRPGDENEPTANGRSTKRQSKINMIEQFSRDTGMDVRSPKAIVDGLTSGIWLGTRVSLKIQTREWEGRIFNDVKKVLSA